jgi:hypothetical protein
MASTSAPPAAPGPVATRRTGRRKRTVGVALAVVLVVVVAVLFVVPVSHPFSDQVTATPSAYGLATLTPPIGSQVSGTFSTTHGDPVTFEILNAKNSAVYSSDSNYGTFSFSASAPPYFFEATTTLASQTVNISGQFSAPLL